MRAPATTAAKLMPAGVAFVVVALGGTFGYHAIFGSGWPLGLYQTLVTVSTLGDARLVPQTTSQYAFIAVLTVVGYALWALVIAIVAGTLVAIDVRGLWGGRRMAERIAAMRGHVVVVGGGRVGQQVAEELRRAARPLVVVDRNPERVARLTEAGYLAIARDVMEDGVLLEAGLRDASGVVLALPDDAQNLYAVFAVRDVAPQALIVARAESARAQRHLEALGVHRVVMPTVLGGKRLARLLSLPLAADFLETIMEEAGLAVHERAVQATDALAGRAVRDLRAVLGERATLLAVRRDSRLYPLPGADLQILEGDMLLIATVEPPGPAA